MLDVSCVKNVVFTSKNVRWLVGGISNRGCEIASEPSSTCGTRGMPDFFRRTANGIARLSTIFVIAFQLINSHKKRFSKAAETFVSKHFSTFVSATEIAYKIGAKPRNDVRDRIGNAGR